MKQIFPLQYYTESGNLKPPIYFYITLFFIARTWALLIISLTSRETGTTLLAIFYPEKTHFYLGLLTGFIALMLFLLAGRDHDKHKYLSLLWQNSYPLLMVSLLCDLALQIYYLSLHHYQYSLTASIQLVAILWLFLYCLTSKHLRASFIRYKTN
ncbi:DUF2919 domain-containing protein [Psychromonas sp. MME2]|uniref:DUF2919 domain-containing protein n=1 Tax=unclassified Psychromonas TaxID=2614957 RepID=UPI00339CD5B5